MFQNSRQTEPLQTGWHLFAGILPEFDKLAAIFCSVLPLMNGFVNKHLRTLEEFRKLFLSCNTFLSVGFSPRQNPAGTVFFSTFACQTLPFTTRQGAACRPFPDSRSPFLSSRHFCPATIYQAWPQQPDRGRWRETQETTLRQNRLVRRKMPAR